MIQLHAADVALELAPAIGGSVVSLSYRGHDVLRRTAPADLAAGRVLGMAAFPLVPSAGRTDRGRFTFSGRTVQLTPDLPGGPHAIHGQGWQQPWQVVAEAADAATLVFEHPAGDWPWPYRATQSLQVQAGRVRLDLILENLGDEPMPAGLGWHPGRCRLCASTSSCSPGHESSWEGPPGPD